MSRKKRNGFTIVELVIVIAVIAILAAVLIPTFSSLINRANEAADTAMVKNLNTLLVSDEALNGTPETMSDVLETVKEGGYTLEKLTPTSNGDILWDEENNQFVLKNGDDVVYSAKDVTKSAWKLWQIIDEKPTEEKGYSYYLSDNFAATEIEVSAGVDVGQNTIDIVYHNESGTAKDISIRSNGGNLTVNGPLDTLTHYGDVNNVNITAINVSDCYNEKGSPAEIFITSGKIVVSENVAVPMITALSDATNVVIENKGIISTLDTAEMKDGSSLRIDNSGNISLHAKKEDQVVSGNQADQSFSGDQIIALTSDTHVIEKGGYYKGDGVTISSTSNDPNSSNAKYALVINTNEPVTIVGAAFTGNRGIGFGDDTVTAQGAYNVTLLDCTISTSSRGVQLWYDSENNDTNKNSKISVVNCNIFNSGVTDYDTATTSGTQGIILNNVDSLELEITNTKIWGYGYAVLTNWHSSAPCVNQNVDIVVKDCSFKGRAGFDFVHLENSVLNVSNTSILGINTFTGTSEGFGNIVLENGENNTLNIKDCYFEIYRAPATAFNGQRAIDIRSSNNTVNLTGINRVAANIWYESGATLPETISDIGFVITLGENCSVNGSFASSISNVIQGANVKSFDWSIIQPSIVSKTANLTVSEDGKTATGTVSFTFDSGEQFSFDLSDAESAESWSNGTDYLFTIQYKDISWIVDIDISPEYEDNYHIWL